MTVCVSMCVRACMCLSRCVLGIHWYALTWRQSQVLITHNINAIWHKSPMYKYAPMHLHTDTCTLYIQSVYIYTVYTVLPSERGHSRDISLHQVNKPEQTPSKKKKKTGKENNHKKRRLYESHLQHSRGSSCKTVSQRWHGEREERNG